MAGANVETVAKALNLTPRRVQQLVNEGMPKGDRGVYDLGQCMAWYIRYLQKALEARKDPDERRESSELNFERARLAREQADKTALQNAELRADLGRLSVWEEELTTFLAEIRAALLRLPTKAAPELHGDTSQRQRILEAAIHEVLRGLAAYRPARRTARNPQENLESGDRSLSAPAPDGVRVGRRRAAAQ